MADLPEHDVELDAIGLTCPMPLLKAKRTLNGMASGQVLRIVATDPGSVRDFEVFCRQSGTALLACERTTGADGDEHFVHVLRKV